jgi:hypothetical protein
VHYASIDEVEDWPDMAAVSATDLRAESEKPD